MFHFEGVIPLDLKIRNEKPRPPSPPTTNQFQGALRIELAGPQEPDQPVVLVQGNFELLLVCKTHGSLIISSRIWWRRRPLSRSRRATMASRLTSGVSRSSLRATSCISGEGSFISISRVMSPSWIVGSSSRSDSIVEVTGKIFC